MRFRRVAIDFSLPGSGSYPAVATTDLAVGAHEFVAIVGPTGCGKSTLLNVAAGLLVPSSGEVFVLGAELTGINRAAGYLFQQDAVMPWKTARDNVAIGLEVAGTARAEAVAAAQKWLERV
ncbi:MAG TPA: ATP-binding cassette domain-containing protein, partial [Hyphomicrobiaceae bacterium]|nr:ATP-binding cassette domain-containing protein [Hyphomicrobiaceae bacterium]